MNLEESDALVGVGFLQMATTRTRIVPVNRRDDSSPRLWDRDLAAVDQLGLRRRMRMSPPPAVSSRQPR